jgi:uncharacterized protein
MKTVHLARGLTLPAAELATEVVASLGQRGSGKSNGAAVIAEGLLEASVQVIVLDHVGIWFSLRLDETGKHPSPYQIPVLGGQHGDIALVASTGSVVAEALARSGSSAVLDVSGFSKGDRCRFAADFAEAFFRAKKLHPGPVQILLEEAQRYVPQKLFAGQGMERMLGAFEEIAEVGRNYGVGLHLISQRPQKINKDVLNLADTVLGYRANGVLERKAISEWVQEKGAEGRKEVHDELPGLARGTAIVWSPSRQIYGRYAIGKKTTYDAGATPIHARAAVKTKPLDLESLESAMGKAVEESKQNDPRVLKSRIAELERELAKKPTPVVERVGREKRVEVPVFREADLKRIERFAEKILKQETSFGELIAHAVDRVAQAQQTVVSSVDTLATVMKRSGRWTADAPNVANPPRAVRSEAPGRREVDQGNGIARVTSRPAAGPADLSKCARALLAVLAQRGTATDSQIAALSGYKRTSSTFANGMSELRTRAYFTGDPGARHVTHEGREAAGPIETLPTGKALLDYWVGRLTRAEAELLKVVYESDTIDRQTLSERSGYRLTSSTFANALSGIRTLDLVHGHDGGDVTIAEVFKKT